MIKLGAHVSIAKSLDLSVDRATNLSCDYMQIFPCSPRSWQPFDYPVEVISKFRDKLAKSKVESVFIHGIYLINLGSNNQDLIEKSIRSLSDSLNLQAKIRAEGVILHPGSAVNSNRDDSIKGIAAIARKLLSKNNNQRIIFESSAGAGETIGSSLEDLATIDRRIGLPTQTAFCLDTCHMFASGIDIVSESKFERQIASTIGFNRIAAIHLNDSETKFNSKRDRHADIGKGEIGLNNLKNFINNKNISGVPIILETPFLKDIDQDKPSTSINEIKKLLS